ncbi:MAG: L-threonylcarbamoyladenylate synthase [Ginsengibacter sp.]
MVDYNDDIIKACSVLKNGGIILYPTDTIWGLGCDATNVRAVQKIFDLKLRADSKALIILVAEETDVVKYIHTLPDFKNAAPYLFKPLTIIYEQAKNLAPNVLAEDGSVAIRIVKDNFCKALIKALGEPIVSTSANVSGLPAPSTFHHVTQQIKNGVDYMVQHRRNDLNLALPSSIIKLKNDGTVEVIRP